MGDGARIAILHPVLAPGDATSNHVLALRRVLRAAGHAADIYTEHTTGPLAGEVRHHHELTDADLIIYQMAVGSVLADRLGAGGPPFVVNYHNFTPVEHFEMWDPVNTWAVRWGRRQLRELAPAARGGIAVSRFNELDLIEAGYARTSVVPVLVDPATFAGDPDPATLDRLDALRAAGGTDWLFVGRIAPNKAQHDIIKAFACYRRLYDPDARLWLVGGVASDRYREALDALVADLRLRRAVRFTGPVSAAALAAHYARADVLVCLSRHEGFGVPLLEAMHHGVPVVARAAAAVPETAGDAAVLLADPSPAEVAAAVHLVVTDDRLRGSLVAAGRRRVAHFDLSRTGPAMVSAVEELL